MVRRGRRPGSMTVVLARRVRQREPLVARVRPKSIGGRRRCPMADDQRRMRHPIQRAGHKPVPTGDAESRARAHPRTNPKGEDRENVPPPITLLIRRKTDSPSSAQSRGTAILRTLRWREQIRTLGPPWEKNANMRSRAKIAKSRPGPPRRGEASSDPFINCPADRQYCGI